MFLLNLMRSPPYGTAPEALITGKPEGSQEGPGLISRCSMADLSLVQGSTHERLGIAPVASICDARCTG